MKLSFLDYCNLLKINVPVDNEKLHFSEGKNKMARLEGETSNDLFETLEDWNAILEQLTPQYDEVSP